LTKVNWTKLSEEIDNKPTWNKILYKTDKTGKRVRIPNFINATWRVSYNDGSYVDGPKDYGKLNRKDIDSISIVIGDKILHTVKVVDDQFVIRLRNAALGFGGAGDDGGNFSIADPKRVFILSTVGKVDFVWDDGDIDELPNWGDQEPYRPINPMEQEI